MFSFVNINRIFKLHPAAIFGCLVARIKLFVLQLVYKFNKWHTSAPYHCRPYKKQVVNLANSLHVDLCVEVGCGLGDVISRVKSKCRFGFDIDEGAVAAAKYLHTNTYFYCANLQSADLIVSKVGKTCADALLILVNWPHELPWDNIHFSVAQLIKSIPFKYVIIDAIDDGVPGFSFCHKPSNFNTIGEVEAVVRAEDNIRSIYLIRIS